MTHRPRVLWWLPELVPDPGGIATFAGDIAPVLAEMGNDVELFVVQGGPSQSEHRGVPVSRLPLQGAFRDQDVSALLRARRDIRQLKERVRADIYHIHLCEPSPSLHLTTIDTHPAPLILTLHNEMSAVLSDTGPQSLFGKLLAEARVITTVSSAATANLIREWPDLAGKVVTVPNGVDIGDPPESLPQATNVLACGRLVPQKRFDRLILALPDVRANVPNLLVHIAGDGPEIDTLRQLSTDLGVGDIVTFLGHLARDEVHEQFDWARVVVAPSHREGMPYVVLEAGERGRPVVGTDIGGINEVLIDEQTGVLVDQESVDADPRVLARAIERVLLEGGLAEHMGARARERIVSTFSTSSCAQAYDVIYRIADHDPSPLVSVIIPAYQAERFIGDAIASVLRQDFDDFEIIVVDDGSTDLTGHVASQIGGNRVTVLRQPNAGSGVARNSGLAISRGAYIAHLDADDIWPADRLSRLVTELDADSSLDAVFGRGREFADHDAPATAQVNTSPQSVRILTTGLIRAATHIAFGPFASERSADMLTWSSQAISRGLRYREIDHLVLERRIHSSNNSHLYPFLETTSRVAIIKQALDAKRRAERKSGESTDDRT